MHDARHCAQARNIHHAKAAKKLLFHVCGTIGGQDPIVIRPFCRVIWSLYTYTEYYTLSVRLIVTERRVVQHDDTAVIEWYVLPSYKEAAVTSVISERHHHLMVQF